MPISVYSGGQFGNANMLRSLFSHRLTRIIFGVLLLAGIGSGVYFWKFSQPATAQASWWDGDWLYRKRIPINYGGSEILTEYQVLIDGFDTASLVSSGQLQSDCDDLRFIDESGQDLPYFIVATTCNTSDTEIWVQVAEISASTRIWVYYGNPVATIRSDELETFSYSEEKPVAYVLDSTVNQLEVISLADNNSISHNGTTLSLDSIGSLGTFASVSQYGVISATKPFQADDLSDDTDQSVPISWAGTEFLYYARNGGDSYFAIAPWGTASVDIWDDGVSSCTNQSVATTGTTISGCTTTGGAIRIQSDVPILIFHEDGTGDPHPLHPSDLGPWYGGSNTTSLVAGSSGATAHSHESLDASQVDYSMAADSRSSAGGVSYGNSGFKLWSDDYPIGAHQQADGDGSDALMYRLGREMGTLWGSSASNTDYVTLVSNQAATCVMYNASDNSQITSVTLSSSNTQVYFAGIGTGGSTTYTTADWYIKCDEPVAAYYQKGGTSESGMQTTIDMRQFTYPTPSVGTFASEESVATPIQWLSFDNLVGTTVEDRTAQDDTGTLTGGAEWAPEQYCRANSCVKLDGTDDYVNLSGDAFNQADETGSISVWARSLDPSDTEMIFYTAEARDRYIYIDGGVFKAAMFDGNPSSFRILEGNATDSEWHHLVFTWDITAAELVFYIDGVEVDRYEGASWATVGADDVNYIGGTRGANGGVPALDYFQGFIDEFQVFDARLSAEAVRQLYVGTSPSGVSAAFSADSTNLTDGLVGHWSLDEPIANTCPDATSDSCDSSGSKAHGEWTGAVTEVQGKYSWAADFSGTAEYITMGDIFYSDELTVCLWMNADDLTGTKNLVVKRNSAGGTAGTNEWQFVVNSGSLSFASWDSSGNAAVSPDGTTTLTTGTWYHVCGVQQGNGKDAHVYVNGLHDASDTQIAPMRDSSSPIQLAVRSANNDARYWDGTIDEVRIYNRALSEQEIYQIYTWAPGPLAYWKGDDQTGSGLYDSSGNGVELTHGFSSPIVSQGKYGNAADIDGTAWSLDYYYSTDASLPEQFPGRSNGVQEFTITGWIYGRDYSARSPILTKQTDPARSFTFVVDDGTTAGQLLFEVAKANSGSPYDTDLFSSFVLSENTWYHVAVTYKYVTDGTSEMQMYINGVLDNSTNTAVGPLQGISADLDFGRYYWNAPYIRYWDGLLDDFKVYDYVRTPRQIVEDMNGGRPFGQGRANAAASQYHFDEMNGDVTHDVGFLGVNGDLGYAVCSTPGTVACPSWTPNGVLNGALFFDGDDLVATPDINGVPFFEEGSISFWFKVTDDNGWDNYNAIYNRYTDVSNSSINFINIAKHGTGLGGPIRADFGNAAGSYSTVTGTTSFDQTMEYTHVVVTWNQEKNSACIYINGVEDACNANMNTWPATFGDMRFGRDRAYSNRYFEGYLDEFKLLNFEMSQEEIKNEYAGTAGAVLGAFSTESDGRTPTNSSARAYCPPGDTETCNPPLFDFPFDEGTGTSTVYDVSGNHDTGTLNGSMTADDWAPGKVGNALDLDGSNDYVSVGNDAALQTNNFTITAWVYPRDNTDSIITKGTGRGSFSTRTIDIFQTGSVLQAVGSDGVSTYIFSLSTDTLPLFTWSHIALSWDGTTNTNAAKLYVNGKLVDSTTPSSSSLATTYNWNIGSEGTYVFDGMIDQVRMYGYARTARQINWEYLQGAPFMQYRFDECSGDVINNSAPTASASAAGYTASLSVGGSGTNTFKGSCDSGVAADAWYDGRDGKENASIYLDGTDDYISCGAGIISEAPQLPITMSAWIYKVAGGGYIGTGYDGIIALSDGSNYAGVSMSLVAQSGTNYNFGAGFGDNTGSSTSNRQSKSSSGFEIPEDEWTHVAAVIRSGTDIELYVNGQEIPGAYSGTGGNLAWGGTECVIGKSWGSAEYYFHGKIDDVKIFPYDLSAEQMKTLYNNGAVSFGN